MFGTLRPHRCSMPEQGRDDHSRLYCGLCKALGDGYGQPYRGLLSHDAVFLGVLADAFAEQQAPPDSARCPMLPVVHKPTVAPGSVAMRFASAMQVLLAEQWLLDRALDGSPWMRAAHPLLAGKAELARERLGELGVDVAPLLGFERRQLDAEVPGALPDEVAQPTGAALSHVFRSVAGLPGVHVDQDTHTALGRLGDAVGRAIYLLDALEDLGKDARAGSFNACLDPQTRRPSRHRTTLAAASLRQHLRQIRHLMGELPLQRHREILESALLKRLHERAHRAIRDGRRALPDAQVAPDAVSRRQALGWLLTAWLWLLSFVVGPLALAQDRSGGDKGKKPGGGKGGNDRGGKDESGDPGELCEDLGDAAGDCVRECQTTCESCLETCSDGARDCLDCDRSCRGCCDECGKSLDCCKECESCGGCCQECQRSLDCCNDCGKGCDDCGKCCNDCDDCGKGCNDCGDCGKCDCCKGCNVTPRVSQWVPWLR